ncbi:hypothetical protein QYE76_015284 [Lolium multiflorum]|uniref:Serine/threonine-protein kinase BSK1-like TPR repeats domain-containing protein n=1 Tax=Lolium multiflorum TaxID=4521 RepID=A0AAD8U4M4_LOLMU|nr:hypothetical protein QYE76_015284 [Lolium multiflorum]
MAPTRSACIPLGGRPMLDQIFQAVSDGDYPRFKAMVMILGTRTGNLKETVESLTVEDPRLPGAQGYNALHLAAIRGGRLDICRYLVEEIGVDVNSTDKEGNTPLFLSLLSADVSTTKYLLDHGANPNKAKQGEVCPLHQAAGSGDCDIVELLLAKGAYVDPLASNVTPLYLAAREGNDAAMKILLDHNADYNRMVNGKTPLMRAMDSASRKCMHLLIKAGADIMGAAMYAVDSPNAAELLSPDFFSCVLEDIGNHQYDLDADEPVAKRRTRIARFKSLGDNCFKTKDYVSAAGYYTLALYLVPDDAASATLFSNRSLCWLHMGDGGKALLDAEECQKKRPDWPKAHYRMGTALMFLKDYQRACERFSDALKLDPGSSEIEDALRKVSESLKLSRSKQV